MAKLSLMPAQEQIDMMSGVIDYYVHCGVPCARKWPRSPGHDRAPAVEAQWDTFSFAASYWNNLSPEVKESWDAMATGSPVTGRDLFMKSFIAGDTLAFS